MKLVQEHGSPLTQLQRLEVQIATLVPVAAILILAVVGMNLIPASESALFMLGFILCALCAGLTVFLVKRKVQKLVSQRIQELIMVCQRSPLSQQKATVNGKDDLSLLAIEINKLLEARSQEPVINIQQGPAYQPHTQQAQAGTQHTQRSAREGSLSLQLENLLQDISPILSGDLRTRAQSSAQEISPVADTVNYLQEELITIVKKVRNASDYILSVTRDLLDRTVDMAQITENQMGLLSNATERIEELVAFTQRLTGTLTITREAARDIRSHLQGLEETTGKLSGSNKQTVLPLLKEDIERQLHLLETFEHSTEERVAAAEKIISELYTLAQRIHQASMGVLNSAERVSGLALMADEWRTSTEIFTLPDAEADTEIDEDVDTLFEEENDLGLLPPFRT